MQPTNRNLSRFFPKESLFFLKSKNKASNHNRFTDFPLDVFQSIFDYLDLKSAFRVMLTCKKIGESTKDSNVVKIVSRLKIICETDLFLPLLVSNRNCPNELDKRIVDYIDHHPNFIYSNLPVGQTSFKSLKIEGHFSYLTLHAFIQMLSTFSDQDLIEYLSRSHDRRLFKIVETLNKVTISFSSAMIDLIENRVKALEDLSTLLKSARLADRAARIQLYKPN